MSEAVPYGRSKPGRPKILKPLDGPACEVCRCLRTDAHGDLQCAAGRSLIAHLCLDFKSAAIERVNIGGETGRLVPK